MPNTVAGVLAPLTGGGYQAVQATANTSLAITTPASATTTLVVAFSSSLGFACSFTTSSVHTASAVTGLQFVTGFTGQLTLQALMETYLQINSSVPAYDPTAVGQVWVANLDTGASSRYADFAFNSYGMLDGKYMAARDDGIYLLQGTSDDGVPIQTAMDFGRLDFSTSALKRVTNAYIGVSSDAQLVLKVVVGEETYVYTARTSSEELQMQRFDLGKGLRSTYFDFVLHGNGAQFDLASIEFVPLPLRRRI